MEVKMNSDEKSALLAELTQLGIKHTPEKIVKIAKQADGKIVFLEEGMFLGYQGTVEPRREIYEVNFNGKKQYIAVTVGDNGYIVGANPASLP